MRDQDPGPTLAPVMGAAAAWLSAPCATETCDFKTSLLQQQHMKPQTERKCLPTFDSEWEPRTEQI